GATQHRALLPKLLLGELVTVGNNLRKQSTETLLYVLIKLPALGNSINHHMQSLILSLRSSDPTGCNRDGMQGIAVVRLNTFTDWLATVDEFRYY
ncbi:MAG: hypothetical protein AAGA67_13830, partial [Cyanobacteria bacterium P01_F01_bin.153]